MWYDTNFYVIRRINEEKKKKVCNVMWCDFLCDMTIDPKIIIQFDFLSADCIDRG